ncbi:Ig-like domain-containing protein [Capnocytophaga cynodegmi]|uniref:Ig-like domain-containing protein n=1 Tax=Capnocytophaga cynodegmi TaxID=28189 RepID=UPI00385F8CE9
MKRILFLLLLTIVFIGCSKNEDKIEALNVTTQELSLYADESLSISAQSGNKITYTSENPLIAKVDESGKVTAHFIGETKIKVTDGVTSKEVKVIVTPKYTYFHEPIILVASKEEFIEKYSNIGGQILTIDDNTLCLFNRDTPKTYFYSYSNSILNGYKNINLNTPINSYYTPSKIISWIKERYVYVKQEGRSVFFASLDGKVSLAFTVSINGDIATLLFSEIK